jgi:hypothetical protein
VRFRVLGLLLAAMLFSGCATRQPPIDLSKDYFQKPAGRIGLLVTELPKPDTNFPGADCLLCMAVASAANSALTDAVRTWPTTDLQPLKGELVQLLQSRGAQVVSIDEPVLLTALPDRPDRQVGFAVKNFSSVAGKAGVDRLLVVNVHGLGAWRNYSAYIPRGDPRAVFRANAFIVDAKSHRLDWYQEFDLFRTADGAWDEPPKFPGLSNAHFQVMELGKDAIKKALSTP